VLEVDHSPIGLTTRSVPISYIGSLSEIRTLFSMTPGARARGYRPGRFSFNVPGGRCEACKGHGSIKAEMSFLPDVYITCEVCEGNRFNRETLDITYKGKNIAEVLSLTFEEAATFFSAVPRIRRALRVVCQIGLGYLTLGQPSPTLSGGEAQRIKIAKELAKTSKGHTLYILDEPTTGLHMADISTLIQVLQALAGRRNDGPDDEPPEPASGPPVVRAAAPRGRITKTRPSSSSLQEQIPMPREAAAVPDQEDRHFRNF